MANTHKITKKDRYNQLLEIEEVRNNPDLVEFIRHELELLAKKNNGEKKLTEKQTVNAAIARSIVALMEENPTQLFTVTELQKKVSGLPDDMTNQRLSAIIRTLLAPNGTGEVERVEDKRKVYFKLA